MANQPNFGQTPVTSTAQLSVANPNRDGTGVMYDVVSAGANGTRIDTIMIKATGATTAGMIRFYIATSDNVTQRLIFEIPVAAVTPSATVATFEQLYQINGGLAIPPASTAVPAGYKLRASTQNSETFNVTVFFGSDF